MHTWPVKQAINDRFKKSPSFRSDSYRMKRSEMERSIKIDLSSLGTTWFLTALPMKIDTGSTPLEMTATREGFL